MASLNIPSTCTDPSYRYKMPAIVTKVEGKGKMIKTLILNMDAVAKALGRPASYIVRFFGTELGSPSKDDMIISGTHSAATLQSLLDKFIEKYVLCRKCCNPEVELSVQKGIVSGHCVACGWCGPMENNDKLAEFILKQDNKDKGNGKKMDKRERQLAKANAAKETAQKLLASAEVNEDNDAATNAGAEMRPEIKKKGEKKEKKEHKEKKEKKAKQKKDKSNSDRDNADVNDDADDTTPSDEICEVIASMVAFISHDPASNVPAICCSLTAEEFLEETRNHQLAKAFDHRVRLHVALESLLRDSLSAECLQKMHHLWGAVAKDAGMKASDILDAFGMYLLRHPTEASVSKLSPVLKLLYDEDWLDESGTLEYYEDQAQNPLRDASIDAAQPFLRWLRESDSESESEDDTET